MPPVIQKKKQRGPETYPQSKDESQTLRISIIKAMGIPSVQNQIVKALQMDPQMGIPFIIKQATDVIVGAIRQIKKDYSGKTHVRAVEMCIEVAIRQVELISKGVGMGPIPQQMKMLLKKGIGMSLDKALEDPNKQQSPQQPQQMAPQGQQQMPQPQQQPAQQMMPPEEQGLLGG